RHGAPAPEHAPGLVLALHPDPAADVRHDDPDALLVGPEDARQHRAELVRRLARGPDGERARVAVPRRADPAALQRRRRLARRRERRLHDGVRAFEDAFGNAGTDLAAYGDVIGPRLVEPPRAGDGRLDNVCERRLRIPVDADG